MEKLMNLLSTSLEKQRLKLKNLYTNKKQGKKDKYAKNNFFYVLRNLTMSECKNVW